MTTTAKSTVDKLDDDQADHRVANAARHVAVSVAGVAGSVAGVAGEVSARLPEAANTTREAFDEASRLVRSGSDETLKIVGALSIGFAGGLLVGGANRLLVLAALIPAGLVGSTFIERMNGTAS